MSDVADLVTDWNAATIVGLGGDFGFQLEEWDLFCDNIKDYREDVKTLLYTGFVGPEELFSKHAGIKPEHLRSTDAIIWGRHDGFSNTIRKILTLSSSDHFKVVKTFSIPLEQ